VKGSLPLAVSGLKWPLLSHHEYSRCSDSNGSKFFGRELFVCGPASLDTLATDDWLACPLLCACRNLQFADDMPERMDARPLPRRDASIDVLDSIFTADRTNVNDPCPRCFITRVNMEVGGRHRKLRRTSFLIPIQRYIAPACVINSQIWRQSIRQTLSCAANNRV
jgi:hypothetical protein